MFTDASRQFKIRKAKVSDATAVNELATNVFNTSDFLITTAEEFSSFTVEEQERRIQTFLNDPSQLMLVASRLA